MPDYLNDPEHWRALAKDMRALAEEATDPTERIALRRIASQYEKLAARAEARTKS